MPEACRQLISGNEYLLPLDLHGVKFERISRIFDPICKNHSEFVKYNVLAMFRVNMVGLNDMANKI